MKIRVIGAGVAGLTCAYELARAGETVEIIERASGPGLGCSFHAGGMIAPWCEAESAEPLVVEWGREVARLLDDRPCRPPRSMAARRRAAARPAGSLALCAPHDPS